MNKKETRSQKLSVILAKRIIDIIYGSNEPFTFIIKGHLLVDALLMMIIEGNFIKPEKLKLDRLTYDTKISLCEADGLIHSEIVPVLQKLGSLRNRFAHKLWLSIEKQDALNFINTLKQSNLLRNQFIKKPKKDKSILQDGIYVICMYLFDQLLRTNSAKSNLHNFWVRTVDEDVQKSLSINLMPITGPLSKTETAELFSKAELKKLKAFRNEKE